MCTVVILYRPGHDWPLILGANRDEMRSRPWEGPGRHWEDRPHVTAGKDILAGGSWLGMNDDRLAACILNRVNSLGPAPDKRSRGELPLDALDHAEARVAAEALSALDPTAYRSFNMVIGDASGAYWLANDEESARITFEAIPEGLSMVTAHDLNDREGSERIRHHLPRFRAAPAPEPASGDWFAWEALMADRTKAAGAGWGGAMAIAPSDFDAESEEGEGDGDGIDFGTVSSSLIALPAPGTEATPVWRFAPGMPGETPYYDVLL